MKIIQLSPTLVLLFTFSLIASSNSSPFLLAKSRLKKQNKSVLNLKTPRNLNQKQISSIHPRILNEDNDKFVANVDKMTEAYGQMDELIDKIRGQMLDVKHTYFSEFSGLVHQLDTDGGGSVLDQMLNKHFEEKAVEERRKKVLV